MIKQNLTIRLYPWTVDHDPERIALAAFKAALAASKKDPDTRYTLDVTEGVNVVATVWNEPSRT